MGEMADYSFNSLSSGVKPKHYDLLLHDLMLSASPCTYRGHVEIDLLVEHSTCEIVLNSHLLTIKQAYLITLGKRTRKLPCKVSVDKKRQRSYFRFDEELRPSECPPRLEVDFSGRIDDDLAGFFRFEDTLLAKSKYKHGYTYSTQFQPADARRAFPCFDQPALKATFKLSIEVPDGLTALSNMPIASTESVPSKPNTTMYIFQTTPIMSTYLLAWSIGGYEYLQRTVPQTHGTGMLPIRVYTSPTLTNAAHFALDLSCRIIPFFSKMFGIDYPLPKLDLLAVLEMSDGAMENWGLLIFRTSALLAEPEEQDPDYLIEVAYTLAHEIAHQWFGNLVTMAWWDELWLNEGFATWAGWTAVHEFFPQWDVWSRYIIEDMGQALDLDSLSSTHPIQVPVPDDLEVDSIFDDITYLKSSAIIRMLAGHVGEEVFLQGVTSYLKAHTYGSATAKDLWQEISKSSGYDIEALMNPWIQDTGYPLIQVKKESPSTILASRGAGWGRASRTVRVPIVTQYGGDHAKDVLNECPIVYKDTQEPFKVNSGHTGYFRTVYDGPQLERVKSDIGNFAAHDQIGLITDAMGLTWSGKNTNVDLVFSLVLSLRHSNSMGVWAAIDEALSKLQCFFSDDPQTSRLLDNFILHLTKALADRLGWHAGAQDDYNTNRLRATALSMAGLAGSKAHADNAVKIFREWARTGQLTTDPSLRPVVFSVAVASIGNEALMALWKAYNDDESGTDSDTIVYAMGFIQEPKVMRQCLNRAFGDDGLVAQDILDLVSTMAANGSSHTLWDFIEGNWDLVVENIGGTMALFDPFVRDTLQYFSSSSLGARIRRFFARKNTAGYRRGLSVGYAFVEANAAFFQRENENAKAWLQSHFSQEWY